MSKTSVNERINAIINYTRLTQRKFSEEIGVPQTTISNLFSRGSQPSVSLLNSIVNRFGEISSTWLLTGEGSMFKRDDKRTPPGELLNLFLKEKGITKEEFADKMGISLEEADKHLNLKDGNMDYMFQWAKNLGTNTTELFMGADLYLQYLEREQNANENPGLKDIASEPQAAYEDAGLLKEVLKLREQVKELGELNKVLKEMIEVQKGAISDKETIIELLKETMSISSSVKEKSTLK